MSNVHILRTGSFAQTILHIIITLSRQINPHTVEGPLSSAYLNSSHHSILLFPFSLFATHHVISQDGLLHPKPIVAHLLSPFF
jgi:hypothetical protein